MLPQYSLTVFISSVTRPGTTEYVNTLPDIYTGLSEAVVAAFSKLELGQYDYVWLRRINVGLRGIATLPDVCIHKNGDVIMSRAKWTISDFITDN